MTRDPADTRRHFETLFAHSDDPWQYAQRWYEARKRALTLGVLTRPRYASGFEPACANGELSAGLAERCDRLLISDGTAAAVALAASRVARWPHVQAVEAWLPEGWPEQRFDLIVLSEIGYYLQPDALDRTLVLAGRSLLPGGDLVACHWRHPLDDGEMSGDEVHRRIAAQLGLPCLATVEDKDFRIDVWSDDARSVAQREG